MNTQITKMFLSIILAVLLAFTLLETAYFLFPDSKTTLFTSHRSLPDLSPSNPLFNIGFSYQLPAICICSDGSINSSMALITQIDKIYNFTTDIINYTIAIQKDNIIIDGSDHTLQGFSNNHGYAKQGIIIQNRDNITITNLNLRQFETGIFIQNSSNIIINGNTLTEIGSNGIYINSSNNSTIVKNNINNVATAITISNLNEFSQLSNNRILENNITIATQGVNISPGSANTISSNIFMNVSNVIGVNGNTTIISNNILINGIVAIGMGGIFAINNDVLIGGSNNLIFNNYIENFSGNGLILFGGNNTIYENTIKNVNTGIWLQSNNWTKAENNIIYHNNFGEMIQNICVDSSELINYWDNNLEGNYWSNYTSTDVDEDGIYDAPYIINFNNTDRFPLMLPYGQQPTFLSSKNYTLLLGASFAIITSITVGSMYLKKWIKRRKIKY